MKPLNLFIFLSIFIVSTTAYTADDAVAPPAENTSVSPEPTAVSCVPACRSGFMCHAGMCISQCNPPCGAGYFCSAQGECIAQQVVAPPLPPAPVAQPALLTDRELARRQARERKQEIRAHRLEMVKQFRIGVHMDWQWNFTSGVYRTGLMANIGFQKNIASTFALRGRIGGMLGYARPHFFDGEDRTGCWGANIDLAPLFGPLGRFYIGPAFWLTYYWHGKDTLESYDWISDDIDGYVDTETGPTGGIALDMGILMGSDANVGLNWRAKTTLTEDPAFTFEIGLAYHFSVGPN